MQKVNDYTIGRKITIKKLKIRDLGSSVSLYMAFFYRDYSKFIYIVCTSAHS